MEALIEERRYSKGKWYSEFDDKNTLNDWVTYICMYATQAARIFQAENPDVIYSKLIKSANLAMLAAERVRTGKRGKRHYDPEYLGDFGTSREGVTLVSHGGPPRDLPVDDDAGPKSFGQYTTRPGGDGIPVQHWHGPE